MRDLNCDTEVLKETGMKVINNAKELECLIIELYNKLYAIQKNNIWHGLASNYFLEKISNDKNNMINFKKDLEEYGKSLLNSAEKYDLLVKKYNGVHND